MSADNTWYESLKAYIAKYIKPNNKREITGARMNTVLNGIVDATYANLAEKMDVPAESPTEGNFASFDSNGGVKDSGHKHSDYATKEQGEKADKAVQKLSVSPDTVTGAPGTNASVANVGTDTDPILKFTIPRGSDAIDPFKGTFAAANIPDDGSPGDFIFVVTDDDEPSASVYMWDGTAFYDTGLEVEFRDSEFSTGEHVSETGIDSSLTIGSDNLPTSGAAYIEVEKVKDDLGFIINGGWVVQATEAQGRYINARGEFQEGYASCIIDVSRVCGKHITATGGNAERSQYAFITGYDSEGVTFVPGNGRVTGVPTNEMVPYGTKYLYYYCGPYSDPSTAPIPTITVVEGEVSEKDSVYGICSTVGNRFARVADAVLPLYFSNSAENSVALGDNIVLSENGDSMEFEVVCGCMTNQSYGGYGFARGGVHINGVGIGCSYTEIAVRADDGTYMFSNIHPNRFRYAMKIVYADDEVKLYIDGVHVGTYATQKQMTISGFGNGATKNNGSITPDYGYWNGAINWLKVNGEVYDFSSSTFSGDFDLPKAPDMMFKKTSDDISVYIRKTGNIYIHYPVKHKQKDYDPTDVSFYDVWGLKPLTVEYWNGTTFSTVETIFRAGESELAIEAQYSEGGAVIYVGGETHGFENVVEIDNVRRFGCIVDGRFVGEDDVVGLKEVSSVRITQTSLVYQPNTTTNPFATADKTWVFEDNSMKITVAVEYTRSVVCRNIMQGMFCVFRHAGGSSSRAYLTNKAVKENKPYILFDVSDGWESDTDNLDLKTIDNGCNRIYEYGETQMSFALGVTDDNRDASGGMIVATNSSTYNKIYYAARFGSIGTVASGTEYHATQIWDINL